MTRTAALPQTTTAGPERRTSVQPIHAVTVRSKERKHISGTLRQIGDRWPEIRLVLELTLDGTDLRFVGNGGRRHLRFAVDDARSVGAVSDVLRDLADCADALYVESGFVSAAAVGREPKPLTLAR